MCWEPPYPKDRNCVPDTFAGEKVETDKGEIRSITDFMRWAPTHSKGIQTLFYIPLLKKDVRQ